MGDCQNWKKFTRDLHIDLVKGHVLSGRYTRLGNLNVYCIFGMEKKIADFYVEGKNCQERNCGFIIYC